MRDSTEVTRASSTSSPLSGVFALCAAPRALLIVGAVEDLALRDAGEPRHQRRFAGALELAETLE